MERLTDLILDTGILIAAERRGDGVEDVLLNVRAKYGEVGLAISALSVVELTHGVYRARTEADRSRRKAFVEGVYSHLIVYPLTLNIARLAGQIEGEQAAQGNTIDLADLLIGATALHLGYSVTTLNTGHFERIPGLEVVTL